MNKKDTKQTLRSWQRFYISSDPSFGSLIASILNSLDKNKYNSLTTLLDSIDKNTSINLSRDGTLDLLFKIKDLIKIVPKFYITNYLPESLSQSENEFAEEILTIKCDFILFLNNEKIKGLTDDYFAELNNALGIIKTNNNYILIKYLLKLINENNYFASLDFLGSEIFESTIPGTNHKCSDFFTRFSIVENSTISKLLTSANSDRQMQVVQNNVKVINVPFTAYHTDNYLSRIHHRLLKDKFNIGKQEFHVKLIFLNAEYLLQKTNKTVFDILVEKIYSDFFTSKSLKKNKEDKDDTDDNEALSRYYSFINSDNAKLKKDNIKTLIVKNMMNEKLPTREINSFRSIDIEKLRIKRTFLHVLNQLSNPTLSNLVFVNAIKILKQYIISNYGDNLKSTIPEEVRNLIEKKFASYIKKRNCFFVEYFTDLITEITEITDEKEYLVESVIKTSFYFKNFCFKKYIDRPQNRQDKSFRELLRFMGKSLFYIRDSGDMDSLTIIPYLKVKEFLVYLISANITTYWEKLVEMFDMFVPMISSRVYRASYNNLTASMTELPNRSYDIHVTDKDFTKEFNIFKLEEIDYIFQTDNLNKFKNVLVELYNLHQKTGFGFDDRKDFKILVDAYDRRCSEYFLYKEKADRFEEDESSGNLIVALIKKFFNFLPRTLNEQKLHKTMKENRSIKEKTTFFYRDNNLELLDDEKIYKRNILRNKIHEKIDVDIGIESGMSTSVGEGAGKTSVTTGGARKNNGKPGNKGSTVQHTASKMSPTVIKKTVPPPPDKLDLGEERIFKFLERYITAKKDVFFTKETDMYTEKIVIYIKDRQPGQQNVALHKLNTIDQTSTYYSVIKSLIEKSYLVEKKIGQFNNNTAFMLFFTRSYLYYFQNKK